MTISDSTGLSEGRRPFDGRDQARHFGMGRLLDRCFLNQLRTDVDPHFERASTTHVVPVPGGEV
jgi:hypothetical protein